MHVEQVNMVALLYFDIIQSVNVDRGLRFCVVLVSLWAYFYTLKCKNERIEADEHHTKKQSPEFKTHCIMSTYNNTTLKTWIL